MPADRWARSRVYAPKQTTKLDEWESSLLLIIDTEYTRQPQNQALPCVIWLPDKSQAGTAMMGILGLAVMAPRPNTGRQHPQHKVYPYLLRGVHVICPNQVLSMDITYIRLQRGFVYLVAVIDWYSRKERLSNTLDSGFCVDCLEQVLQAYETPEIFNTDQGCQLTGKLLWACSRCTVLPSAWMGVAGH
jgi:putative transposase